jgi:hypothetical protein
MSINSNKMSIHGMSPPEEAENEMIMIDASGNGATEREVKK